MQAEATEADMMTVPRAQRRPPAPTLSAIVRQYDRRDDAIIAAYATGAYSYRQIAEHFGLHLVSVGRIVRGSMKDNGS